VPWRSNHREARRLNPSRHHRFFTQPVWNSTRPDPPEKQCRQDFPLRRPPQCQLGVWPSLISASYRMVRQNVPRKYELLGMSHAFCRKNNSGKARNNSLDRNTADDLGAALPGPRVVHLRVEFLRACESGRRRVRSDKTLACNCIRCEDIIAVIKMKSELHNAR